MTTPEVSCKAIAMQNSSQRPCPMCPFPQLTPGGGGEDIPISPGHPEFWTPFQIAVWGPLLAAPCNTMAKGGDGLSPLGFDEA